MKRLVLANVHDRTVQSFSKEWSRFDQEDVDADELARLFEEYFAIFPWESLPKRARGADIGCGSGRWAQFVARRNVAELHCVDPSEEALQVSRAKLHRYDNVILHHASVDALPFEDNSLDFAYALGVLHHVPDPAAALASSVRALKKGAPFLVYLYYAFDNRPLWFRGLWRGSDIVRRVIANSPSRVKDLCCDALALSIYWPLAQAARSARALGIDVSHWPLSAYRDRSLYTMRTDARDRFGTPLEQRFTSRQIEAMLLEAGLADVRFSSEPPYWCAIGFKV